jgi:polysaccharide biosynthesis protein PslJ
MTAVAERPAPPAPQAEAPAGKSRRQRIDAVTVLTVYVILLMGIPAALVVAPLGAVGGPAIIFAAVVFVFYLVTWLHPALAPQRFRQPVRGAAILFACAIIATYVSVNRHIMPSLERNGADRGLILIFGWLGVLLMASDGIVSMQRLKKLLGRIVILATFMAGLGITQFFTGLDATKYIIIPGLTAQAPTTDLLSRNGLNRPAATAAHPLEFAAVLAMVLPIAINRARFAPPELRVRRWLQVALIGAALPMTVSKAAVLALGVVCLVLLPTWPKLERRIAYVVMILGVAGLWFLVPGLLSTFRTLFATLTGDSSTTSRTSAFSTAMPYISQHPWLGHGFGTFFPATYFFTDDQYLLSLIEIGVVGVLALLGLFITGLVTARKVRHATTNPEIRDLGQCLTATIAVSMVTFATFDALSFGMAAGLTFVFLGCTGAALRLIRAQGAQADGHLVGPPMMPPEQEPPVLRHRPGPDGPAGAGALRAGQQANGHLGAPDERQSAEKPSEQQANGHLPAPAEQMEQLPGPRQEEQVGTQVEKLFDRYLGERADGQPERQAIGHPAEPAEAGPEESAHAQVQQPAKFPWENQVWPWEPQDLQQAEARQEEPAQEEEPAGAQLAQPEAPTGQPAEIQAEQPAEVQPEQPAEVQAQQPAEVQTEEPAEVQAEQPAEQPAEVQAEQPAEVQAEQPAEVQAEQPAEVQAEQPAEVQAERPAHAPWDAWRKAQQPAGQPTAAAPDEPTAGPGQPTAEPPEAGAEQPAEAPWDAWRKGEQPAQPSVAAADQQAAEPDQHAAAPIGQPSAETPGQQAPEPADQPAPEPPGERPEESTIPIPIIRD